MDAPSENRHRLDSTRLAELLGDQWPEVLVTRQTQSTNRDLALAANAGAPAWTLHTTDHQVAGRGRLDRSFEAGSARSGLRSHMDLVAFDSRYRNV